MHPWDERIVILLYPFFFHSDFIPTDARHIPSNITGYEARNGKRWTTVVKLDFNLFCLITLLIPPQKKSKKVVFSVPFVCLSVSLQDYLKTTWPIAWNFQQKEQRAKKEIQKGKVHFLAINACWNRTAWSICWIAEMGNFMTYNVVFWRL